MCVKWAKPGLICNKMVTLQARRYPSKSEIVNALSIAVPTKIFIFVEQQFKMKSSIVNISSKFLTPYLNLDTFVLKILLHADVANIISRVYSFAID